MPYHNHSGDPKVGRSAFRLFIFFLFSVFILLGVSLALAQTGNARTVTDIKVRVVGLKVNSTDDDSDKTPGDGVCDTGGKNKVGDRKCTLRAAIEEANKRKGKDKIEIYGISTAESGYNSQIGIHSIKPRTALPQISDPATIIACSPGTSGCLPSIELSGTNSSASYGLNLSGGNSTVEGLIVNRFKGAGILITGKGENHIKGNYIGTDYSGKSPAANSGGGIVIDNSSNNTIGGASDEEINLISGNQLAGIVIKGARASNNTVMGNYIGTDIDGDCARGSGGSCKEGFPIGNLVGVLILGAVDNTIGGGNLISGNKKSGILISSAGSKGNEVVGNFIGTSSSGYEVIGNGTNGAELQNAVENTVGGTSPEQGNVISGNFGHGVLIGGTNSRSNKIIGNVIGTSLLAALKLPNKGNGVHIKDAGNNYIGGTGDGEGNVVSGNEGSGIYITGEGSRSNTIQSNFIGTDNNIQSPAPLSNEKHGVHIVGAPENLIGGTDKNSGNLISGNDAGVFIEGAQATGNKVQGNMIGTNGDGTSLFKVGLVCTDNDCYIKTGNNVGVWIEDAPRNVVGGVGSAKNVISGNHSTGVLVVGDPTTENKIVGNYIGVDIRGSKAIPNDIGVSIGAAPKDKKKIHPEEFGEAKNNYIGGGGKGLGNVVSGNRSVGISVNSGSSGNKIEGNFIGTDVTGKRKISNGVGIDIYFGATDNIIGGASANSGNVISGNRNQGISVSHADRNTFIGNLIGTDVSGKAALGNKIGIELSGNVENSTIGGTTQNSRNVISGNEAQGVLITLKSSANKILGNLIGTDISGKSKLGNGVGIHIVDSPNNMIGGSAKGSANTISGNNADGLLIKNSNGNTIQSNLIGTNANGQKGLGNGGYGISIKESKQTLIGANPASGARERAVERNTIANNKTGGVYIEFGSQNAIRSNRIYDNGNSGISLKAANNNQAFIAPELISANRSNVRGKFEIQPFTDLSIEYFSTPSCNGSKGQGKKPIGTLTVSPKEYLGFNFRPRLPVKPGHFVSVTATDAKGNTSEFSNCVKVK